MRGEMVRTGEDGACTVDRGRIRGAVVRGDRDRDPALNDRVRSDVARLRGGAVGGLPRRRLAVRLCLLRDQVRRDARHGDRAARRESAAAARAPRLLEGARPVPRVGLPAVARGARLARRARARTRTRRAIARPPTAHAPSRRARSRCSSCSSRSARPRRRSTTARSCATASPAGSSRPSRCGATSSRAPPSSSASRRRSS